jgi:hypothetical protein
MFKTLITAGVVLAGLATALPAAAEHGPGYFDRREARQDARIDRGIRSGELTRGEIRDLRRDQQELQRLTWRLRRDGRLSHQERRRLERAHDELSRRIYVLKHNDRYRDRGRHGPPRHGQRPRGDDYRGYAPSGGWWAILGYSSD